MNSENNIKILIKGIGQKAKVASQELALASTSIKNKALKVAALEIRSAKDEIIKANKKDMDIGKGRSLSVAMLDRLFLDNERVEAIALSLIHI